MNIVKDIYYTKSHEWVRFLDETTAQVGITDFAQEQLGDIVFVNLTDVHSNVNAGDALGDIESVKAVSDIYSPLSGTIEEINEILLDQPELINQTPYDAWFVKVGNIENREGLLNAEEYEELLKAEGH